MSAATLEQRSWSRRLLASCARHRRLTVLVVITAMLGTGLTAVGPLVMRVGLNDAVSGRTDQIMLIVIALAVAGLVQFAGAFARQFLAAKLALEVQHDLRTETFSSLQRLDGGKQDSLRTGEIMSRANVDLQMVQGLLSQAPMALGSIVLVVVSFAAMVWLSPLLTLIHVAMVAACAIVTLRSSRALSPATWAVQHRLAVLAQRIGESVAGVYVVKGFGAERREVARFREEAERLYGERMRVSKLQSVPMATLQSLPLLGQVGVLLLGGWLAVSGRISLGDFVAFAAFTTTLTGPAGVLSNLVVAAQLARPAVERVYDLLDTSPDVVDAPDATDVAVGPLGVVLDGVTFGYTRDDRVLDGLSLRVAPGETVAVVGPSGSGKSTVALLLPRFYDPQGGSVRVGPVGAEVDVRQLRMASLRRRVGVVFEEPFLFSSTIAANIAYGHPDADDEQIRQAAADAGAAEFIERLPQGYETPVEERGSTLSGGQRQRIALARTLLSDPEVLVLDDATSALDAATAAVVSETLERATAARTTILIAHRRASLALADRIVVLDGGAVVDSGTEHELLQRCELFRELFAASADDASVRAVRALAEAPAEGRIPALWPQVAPEADGDTVTLDGLPAERAQVEQAAALPAATDRPAERLAREPGPHDRPPTTLFAMLRPVRALVAVAVVLMAFDAGVTTVIPNLVQRGLDSGVTRHDFRTVLVLAGIALAVIAGNWLILFAQPRMITRTGESALFAMRVRCFRHLHSLGLDHFERSRSGSVLTAMTTDISALADFVEAGLTIAVVNLLTVAVMGVAMVVLDLRLALAALAVLPVLGVATVIFRRLSSTAYAETREQIGEVNANLAENLAGLRTAQANGQTDGARQRFGSLSDAFRRIRLRAQSYAAAYFPFITLLSDVATILVLAFGVQRVAAGTLTPGVLTAFLLYLSLFFAPFQQLSMVFDGYQRAKVGAGRIGELLQTPASVPPAVAPVPVPARLSGAVELDGVTFHYPDAGTPSLADLTVSVAPQERVALVGTTGSGKSTLVKLIARLYDVSSGQLLIDGHDVRSYDLEGLRHRMAVVPQEAHLFTGTVADNIRYSRPEASDEEVQSAVLAVGALAMIAELPGGFTHPVGEGGGGLSTGQRQLLALARAQLADPDLLLLDEPTASLDAVSERAVLKAMDELSSARTTFVVTHRLASAARSDRILVLDGGRLLEQGSHDELLGRGGRYAELWALDQVEAPTPPVVVTEDVPAPSRFAVVTAVLLQLAAIARQLVPFRRRRPLA